MSKRLIISFPIQIIFFLLCQDFAICQSGKKLDFSIGTRLRVTPIYLGKLESFGPVNGHVMQQDAHLSGLSLFSGIEYPLSKKMNIGYQLFCRYDEFLTEIPPLNGGIKEPINRFFFDHSLFINYQWQSDRKLKIKNGLGFSINNLNSSYSYWRDDGTASLFMNDKFIFPTFDLPMDFELNRLCLSFTPSFSLKNPFPILQSQFLLLHFSARYNLFANPKSSVVGLNE
jgi:hypothetical protein